MDIACRIWDKDTYVLIEKPEGKSPHISKSVPVTGRGGP
jgi:hypothetical protein